MVIARGQWIRLTACALMMSGAIIATRGRGFADTPKTPVMSAKAKRGAAIFQQNCVSCHNKQADDTTPFGPPNLHGIFTPKSMLHPALTPAEATAFIKKGAAPMPAFAGVLSDAQLSDLIAYLKVQ